jgi:hypothetical protein
MIVGAILGKVEFKIVTGKGQKFEEDDEDVEDCPVSFN